MNTIWKDQYSKANCRRVRVALLGPQQSFGDEDFIQLASKRSVKAIVKSQTAEIVVVSFLKFIENRNNSREICRKLLNMEKSAKNDWRQNFETQIVKMSLNHKLQKAESKLNRELVETIPQLIKSPDEFRNANLEQTMAKESPSKKASSELYENLLSKFSKPKKPQKTSLSLHKKASLMTQSVQTESLLNSPLASPKENLDERSFRQNKNSPIHRNFSVVAGNSSMMATPKLVSMSQNLKKWARHFERQEKEKASLLNDEPIIKNRSMILHRSNLSLAEGGGNDLNLLGEINQSIDSEAHQLRNSYFPPIEKLSRSPSKSYSKPKKRVGSNVQSPNSHFQRAAPSKTQSVTS